MPTITHDRVAAAEGRALIEPVSPLLRLSLLAWRPFTRGALRGFATVQLGQLLRITDVSVLSSNERTWVSLPAKPVLKGTQAVLDERGKPLYGPVLDWIDRRVADRFSAAVTTLILEQHGPSALEPLS